MTIQQEFKEIIDYVSRGDQDSSEESTKGFDAAVSILKEIDAHVKGGQEIDQGNYYRQQIEEQICAMESSPYLAGWNDALNSALREVHLQCEQAEKQATLLAA